MNTDAKIFVTGRRGMVVSAIVQRLHAGGYGQEGTRTRAELDLHKARAFLAAEKPDYVFVAAGKVGGIQANNQYRAEFLYRNLLIVANLIHGALRAGMQRLMFLGSSCIYPRDCSQPIKEDYLLTGPLEPTNEPCALAEIVCNLANSHALPVLIRKAHEAKARGDAEYVAWSSGTPQGEFLYVDDLADACVHLMECDYDGSLVNVGNGEDVTIRELAETARQMVGFSSRIVFDNSKPDRMPRKLRDVSRLAALGWRVRTVLRDGIARSYADCADQASLNV